MKLALLLVLMSFSVFADYKSEKAAIDKFEKEVFFNPQNYAPSKPGTVPELRREFYDMLDADPVAIKYFLLLSTKQRLMARAQNDKAFALSLENRLGGKKLDKASWEKIMKVVGNSILSDSNSTHRTALKSFEASNAYYEKNLKRVNESDFK